MSAIDFTLSTGKKRRDYIDRQHVLFDEKIQSQLSYTETNNASMRLLIDLDKYADTLFSEREITELLSISDYLLGKYQAEYDRMEKEIRKFANELKVLCLEAIEQKLFIKALGD
ncbi:hypothetical protein ACFVHQ_00920 [Actinomycetes bacterium NPDC127524]